MAKSLRDRAWEAMGYSQAHPDDLLVSRGLQWLADKLGDIHLEYMKGDGWGASVCPGQNRKEFACQCREKWQAVAKAILAVKENADD